GGTHWVTWNRDGHRLTASLRNHTVWLKDADTGLNRRFYSPIPGVHNFRQPAFSPDGRMLALAVDATSAVLADVGLGRELQRLAGHGGIVSDIAWDADGKRLATGCADGSIRIWDTATGNLAGMIAAGGDVVGMRWSPDGRRVAGVIWPGREQRQVGIWDI